MSMRYLLGEVVRKRRILMFDFLTFGVLPRLHKLPKLASPLLNDEVSANSQVQRFTNHLEAKYV